MSTLTQLRSELDQIDNELITIISKRIQKGKEIQAVKRSEHLPIEDPARETEILETLSTKAQTLNLDTKLIHAIYQHLFQTVKEKVENTQKK